MNPKYPIYIISKGRHETRLTSKALEKMNVPYKIVIEPQEYNQYANVIDKTKILVLPFSDLGQGSIPARNWVFEHSIKNGADRHWIMDDNIRIFLRVHQNRLVPVADGAVLRAAEDFTDRYTNVALSGLQYETFVMRRNKTPPYVLNTRIYSCILINNNMPFRWRGRYNEDTDLSLRALKAGWCTILFNAFLQGKTATMVMNGGNTDELYAGNGRLKMARSLQKQHPDVASIVWKWDRWHHKVNYKPFKKNKLIRRKGIKISKEVNNYGMKLKKVTGDSDG